MNSCCIPRTKRAKQAYAESRIRLSEKFYWTGFSALFFALAIPGHINFTAVIVGFMAAFAGGYYLSNVGYRMLDDLGDE